MTDTNSTESRRKLLKFIAAGSGAVAVVKSLPESWDQPTHMALGVNHAIAPLHDKLTGIAGIDYLFPCNCIVKQLRYKLHLHVLNRCRQGPVYILPCRQHLLDIFLDL